MKNIFNPNTIYDKILRNDIKMAEGIEFLISFIEKSDNTRLRLESLKILHKMKAQDEKIFKTLENCIISDEFEEIRIIAAKFLLEHYFHAGQECLKWALLNDRSSKFLKSLGKMLNTLNRDRYETFYNVFLQRLDKIAEKLEIVTEEVQFLLDLEFNIDQTKSINWSTNSKLIYDANVMFRVQDQHILELNISLLNQIPTSIKLLRKLEILDLSCNYLTELPNSLKGVINLRYLDLSWNDFKNLPRVLNELNPIVEINFQNNFLKK